MTEAKLREDFEEALKDDNEKLRARIKKLICIIVGAVLLLGVVSYIGYHYAQLEHLKDRHGAIDKAF